MHIAFRADASFQIGTGHVMRCLTLAAALRESGARCTFICRPHNGHLLELIGQRGYSIVSLPSLVKVSDPHVEVSAHTDWLDTDWKTDAQDTCEALGGARIDWLVVDHYALDQLWEQALRPHCKNLMVIDDLADRSHDCDVLLDQNLGRSAQDYDGFLKSHTLTFIGPRYALLRPEFAQLRNQSLSRRAQPQLKHLLITMGGVDRENETGRVLQALILCHLPLDLRITVVMGPHAPCLADVKQLAAQMPWTTKVLSSVNEMAQLMADSDLCIGAAGGTSWERCCLGLPTMLMVLATNQRAGAAALDRSGAALVVNDAQEIPRIYEKYFSILPKLQLKKMSLEAAAVTDGHGVQRVVTAML
jgi:UDP-2,4-diacetamido-2,4,6-trideoxy-beta-L-altropyranose hydrolase